MRLPLVAEIDVLSTVLSKRTPLNFWFSPHHCCPAFRYLKGRVILSEIRVIKCNVGDNASKGGGRGAKADGGVRKRGASTDVLSSVRQSIGIRKRNPGTVFVCTTGTQFVAHERWERRRVLLGFVTWSVLVLRGATRIKYRFAWREG